MVKVDDLIGADEVADLLGTSKRTVLRHADAGRLPVVTRIGPAAVTVFDRAAILATITETPAP